MYSGGSSDHKSASSAIARRVYSSGTTYYASGKVEVHLESSLPLALAPDGIPFPKDEPSPVEDTEIIGVKIKLAEPMDPQMVFEIHDEQGNVLHHVKDVARSEFFKNFMGRFYSKGSHRQADYFLGKNPVTLEGKLKGDAIIVVPAQEWQKKIGQTSAGLERSRIAILSGG